MAAPPTRNISADSAADRFVCKVVEERVDFVGVERRRGHARLSAAAAMNRPLLPKASGDSWMEVASRDGRPATNHQGSA